MTGNCLLDPFCTYFVKKRDSYKIFWLRMKILWQPGSQVRRHYPTLSMITLSQLLWQQPSYTKARTILPHRPASCTRRQATQDSRRECTASRHREMITKTSSGSAPAVVVRLLFWEEQAWMLKCSPRKPIFVFQYSLNG